MRVLPEGAAFMKPPPAADGRSSPFWAPTNWVTVDGLEAMGFRGDARRIAKKFDATIDAGFAADGTIREKFNVVSGNSNVKVTAGYKSNEIGFGWSNAVYLKMKEVMAAASPTTN